MTIDLQIRKRLFFDMAIADILRAIRGRSLMGAFTLSMCAIDIMAYLRDVLPGEGTKQNFVKWVDDYMVPLNAACRSDVLYALRCGLVHTYGFADAMEKCGLDAFAFVHSQPRHHWTQPTPNGYVVNLEDHVAEVTVAAFRFFDDLSSSAAKDPVLAQAVDGRMNRLVSFLYLYESPVVDSRRPTIPVLVTPPAKAFKEMDPALVTLDERVPDVVRLADDIRTIYPNS